MENMNRTWENVKAGDKFTFGNYAPENTEKYQFRSLPITWRVLKLEENRVLVLSEEVLDLQPFHKESKAVCWEKSDLRHWLNTEFLNKAFSKEEQELICRPEPSEEAVDEFLWQMFGMETVTDTIHDQVFLLNGEDIEAYFEAGEIEYKGAEASYTENVLLMEENKECWWLRSSMQSREYACIVSPCATIGVSLIDKDNVQGIRPAMWLKIDKELKVGGHINIRDKW